MGGDPQLLTTHDVRRATADIESMDALILMGNEFDIDPNRYIQRYPIGDPRRGIHPATKSELSTPESAARGEYEEALLNAALNLRMPILGICGGMQRINVACGGTLHQHVPDLAGTDRHDQRIRGIEFSTPVVPAVIVPGTLLARIARGISTAFVCTKDPSVPTVVVENSIHHQAVDIVAPGLIASALNDAFPQRDGTVGYMIKAVEADSQGIYARQFVLGLQWHPEFGASELGSRIIQQLVYEAHQFSRSRASV
jgi:putative glutamine amidotransferase